MSISAAALLGPDPSSRPGSRAGGRLRAWQSAALEAYLRQRPRDFLAVATPGAGKTTFALRVAAELLDRRVIERVTVVTPTEHLKTQWANAAAMLGIPLDPAASSGAAAKGFVGIAVTYAGVAANPLRHRRRTEAYKTLVILDEIHHAADALSWGEAVREAFDPATRRLSLTGTPFRSDINPIPFVTYSPGPDGVMRSAADHTYGYGEALADGVVRPVLFLAYSGRMRWRTRAGDEVEAALGEEQAPDVTAQALRTALDPGGEWIPAVLRAADRRLTEVRRHVPDAGGLVIAADQDAARAYAARLRSITGEAPTVVVSDEPDAGRRIAAFTASTDRWLVAVRMVSEGVDVPRLAVGVYATTVTTPLFFAQAVGRFVRARRRGETASVFLPSVPLLLRHAAEMEEERDHVLGRRGDGVWTEEDALVAAALAERSHPRPRRRRRAAVRGAGERGVVRPGALRRRRVRRGRAHARPGRRRRPRLHRHPGPARAGAGERAPRERSVASSRSRRAAPVEADRPAHEVVAAARRELNELVRAYARQSGQGPAAVHARLRRECGGPPTAQASLDDLRARHDLVRRWAVGRG